MIVMAGLSYPSMGSVFQTGSDKTLLELQELKGGEVSLASEQDLILFGANLANLMMCGFKDNF